MAEKPRMTAAFLKKRCPKCKGELKIEKIINVLEPNDELHKQLAESGDFFPHDDVTAKCAGCKQRWHVTMVDGTFHSMSRGFSRWFDMYMYLAVLGPLVILLIAIVVIVLMIVGVV